MIAQERIDAKTTRVDLMTVTPTMALNWLENANSHNRNVSDAYAARLARDIKEDRWLLTHEGIAFDRNGVLLDGQHRLWAIVLADKPVRLYVWQGITTDALMAINNGKPRAAADILTLAGGHGTVSHRELAILRAMLCAGGSPVRLTTAEVGQKLTKHREAIRFAMENLPRNLRIKGIGTGDTRAVVARAFYSADRSRLIRFCDILRTGMATEQGDGPVVLLWQYLTRNFSNSYEQRRERYRKTQRALLAFLNRERITRLYASDTELFPLPEEIVN